MRGVDTLLLCFRFEFVWVLLGLTCYGFAFCLDLLFCG